MKLFVIACILSIVAGTFAAEMLGDFSDKDHPGKCVFDGRVFSPGEVYHPNGKCKSFLCTTELGYGRVSECSPQQTRPPCRLGDAIKPHSNYPDCCEREVYCPKKRMIIFDAEKEAVHGFQ